MTTANNNSDPTLSETLALEKAAAQTIADAYATFKEAVADALASLPVAQAYNPQVRQIGNAALAQINFPMTNQLPALIASYDPPAPVAPPTA